MPKTLIYLRCDALGDAILSAGMLSPLRSAFADHQFIAVCQTSVGALYQNCPYIDRVLTFDQQRLIDEEPYREDFYRQMRQLKADVCLNTVYSRNDMGDHLVAATRAPLRVGHMGDLSHLDAQRRAANNIAYSQLVTTEPDPGNELARHVSFLRALKIDPPPLAPRIWTSPVDAKFAEAFFDDNGLKDSKKVLAIFAGAQSPLRRYPHFGQALSTLAAERGLFLIGLGSIDEWDLNQRQLQASGAPFHNLSGQTTLLQTAEILRKCRLAVGGETSLAHLACAVQTPNVIVLGGGHFGRFIPYSPLTSAVCLPLNCYACNWKCRFARPHCVTDISPAVLAAAIQISLDKPDPPLPTIFAQDKSLWQNSAPEPKWEWKPQLIPMKVEVCPVSC